MAGIFEGQVAVVTGAGSGLGAATAQRLASEGAHVVVVDINETQARAVAQHLPGDAVAVAADISTDEGARAYTEAAVSHFGHIDLYHLNAGIVGSFLPFPVLSTEEFRRVTDVNLIGTFIGIRDAFAQFARQRAESGAIVVTGSIAGRRASHDILAYQASKHGVHGLVKGAAMYGGPLGIRVNAVAPGLVPTALFASNAGQAGAGDDMQRRGTTVPLRRTGNPDEVAAAVTFLLSDAASYVNGHILAVDGGSAQMNTVRPAGGAGAWSTAEMDAAIRRTAEEIAKK